jgi:tetratricopeptide (TPR) repeat protein
MNASVRNTLLLACLCTAAAVAPASAQDDSTSPCESRLVQAGDVQLRNTDFGGSGVPDPFSYSETRRASNAVLDSATAIRESEHRDPPVRLLGRADALADSLLAHARHRLAEGTADGRDAARSLFQSAIQLAPHDARGYVGVADSYVQGLRTAELSPEHTAAAIAFAQKAAWRQPESADAHFALATAYFRQFWFRLSIEHLLRAWDLEPQARTAYWLGWMFSEVGELHEIMPWLERARALDSELPGLAEELGYAHRVLRNHDEAERWLQRAVAEEPSSSYPHANLLLLYLMQGRDEEALAHADHLISRASEDPVLLGHAGLAYWYLGRTERARELLEVAAATDPMMWVGTWGTIVSQPLGEIYWREGRKEEARAAFANAVNGYRQRFERASEGWGYRYDLAALAAVQGEPAEAYAWLRDAISFGWTDYALARRDPALASLHEEALFREMMEELERKVTEMRTPPAVNRREP